MPDKHRTNKKELQRARDEFRSLLEAPTREPQWQRFFSQNPYVLSMSLPVRIEPHDIFPLGRPGRAEPDFVFYSTRGLELVPTYGVIEIKKPESKIITVTRSNVAILTRDAQTAAQQALEYSLNRENYRLLPKQDSILVLGNLAQLFVIMGMRSDFSRKFSLELHREMINKQLPPNLQIIPYDELLRIFESHVPVPLHVLVPAGTKEMHVPPEDEAARNSIHRILLERAIEALPTSQRIVFVLHDIEGRAHADIAEMMGGSVRTSRSQLSRARARLIDLLDASVMRDVEWFQKLKKEIQR